MRIILTIDKKDYDPDSKAYYRPSSKGIIFDDDHKLILLYSKKFDFYEFPGGGIEKGETRKAALCREIKEETGLSVITESIKPFGCIRKKQKGKHEPLFIQDNFFYFCKTSEDKALPQMTLSEQLADFTPVHVTVAEALAHAQKKMTASPEDSFFQITHYVLRHLSDSIT